MYAVWNLDEFGSIWLSECRRLLPLGSGKFVTPFDRMHCENFTAWSRADPGTPVVDELLGLDEEPQAASARQPASTASRRAGAITRSTVNGGR